jgi:hypothetical protein
MTLTIPEDIRDIRGPLMLPAWWRLPVAIALAAVVVVAAVLVIRWVKARRANRVLTPLERARATLRLAEDHAREGRTHECADLVAETVRASLAERMGTAVLPETTAELASRLWTSFSYEGPVGRPALDVARVVALLETCDLLRFARASIATDVLVSETVNARAVVEQLLTPSAAPAAQHPAPVQGGALSS